MLLLCVTSGAPLNYRHPTVMKQITNQRLNSLCSFCPSLLVFFNSQRLTSVDNGNTSSLCDAGYNLTRHGGMQFEQHSFALRIIKCGFHKNAPINDVLRLTKNLSFSHLTLVGSQGVYGHFKRMMYVLETTL